MKLQGPCPENLCTCGYAKLEECGKLVFHGRRITNERLATMTDRHVMQFCWDNCIDIEQILLKNTTSGLCRRVIGELVNRLEKIEKDLPSGGVDENIEGYVIGSQGRVLKFED